MYHVPELRKQLPFTYIENLFKNVASVQALELSELEEHLLKSVILFNPGKNERQV